MWTPVRQDQFKVSPKGITHTPTGTTYIPHPGAPHSGTMNLGPPGNVANGEGYRPGEVQAMMELLWADYVAANPRLFEVHDQTRARRDPDVARQTWRVYYGDVLVSSMAQDVSCPVHVGSERQTVNETFRLRTSTGRNSRYSRFPC